MELLVAGLILFLGIHSVSIVNEPWRDRMVASYGEHLWRIIYSVVAITGFVLIVWGYGLARQEPTVLYVPPIWLRHLTMLLLVAVFPLLLATYFPGRIQTAARHPMLLATKIWAFAHLLANGMVHDVVLFGSFLAWAVVDRISMGRREQRPIPGAPSSKMNDIIVVVAGVALYGAFVFKLHTWLIGVSPLH